MNWITRIIGISENSPSGSVNANDTDTKYGLPVHEPNIIGIKLGRRTILVIHEGKQEQIEINALRKQFRDGKIPGESPVLVTNLYCQQTYYCGEGTVADVVAAWESAPIEDLDRSFMLIEAEKYALSCDNVITKIDYHAFMRLCERLNIYRLFILKKKNELKKLPRAAIANIVYLLDQENPGWDAIDGQPRFYEELKKRFPEFVRNEKAQRIKKQQDKSRRRKQREQLPVTETKFYLTMFPHKTMQVEVKDIGPMEIRAIKPLLRQGTMTYESLVRYRNTSEWTELYSFLHDWLENKASDRQINYLTALQKKNGIDEPIELDSNKREISKRIDALAPNYPR
jgi:hypothetical protein